MQGRLPTAGALLRRLPQRLFRRDDFTPPKHSADSGAYDSGAYDSPANITTNITTSNHSTNHHGAGNGNCDTVIAMAKDKGPRPGRS
jgi:hypothetical protein